MTGESGGTNVFGSISESSCKSSDPDAMEKLKKILFIVFGVLIGLYLLFVFVLVSFPYHALFQRLDQQLRARYGMGITVEQISFRYPMKLQLHDLRVVQERRQLVVSVDDLFIHLRLLTPEKLKTVRLSGNGLAVRSEWIELSGALVSLEMKFRLFPLLRGEAGNHVASVQLITGGADVQRVVVSGFEFADLRLKQIQIFLRGDEAGFTIERGLVSADVLRSELEGKMGLQNMDMLVRILLTDEFYRKFSDLRQVVDAVFRNGSLQVRLEGPPQNPRFRIVQ